jgi:hypothetical protein
MYFSWVGDPRTPVKSVQVCTLDCIAARNFWRDRCVINQRNE